MAQDSENLANRDPQAGEAVAWACKKCNSPRAVDPCPKCGTALTKPAEGWDWPRLPDIDHIRALAREVGYAIGVHGTLERDMDLIAAPWVAEAVAPLALAQHIAKGIGGAVLDYEVQDKPAGRWSCNIHPAGWLKMIDLSVMAPASPQDDRMGGAKAEHVKTDHFDEPSDLRRPEPGWLKRSIEQAKANTKEGEGA